MYEKMENRGTAEHYVFLVNLDSGGSKSRLAKAAGAEPINQIKKRKIIRRCSAIYMYKSKYGKIPEFRILFPIIKTNNYIP